MLKSLKVEIFEGYWSASDLRSKPNALFVFGDNLIRVGKGGQAIIRDEPNSIGVATKKAPGMSERDFFTDENDNFSVICFEVENLLTTIGKGGYDTIIFPEDGLGTGLSEMPTRCPKLFEYMNGLLHDLFNVNYVDGKFSVE